MLPLPTAKPPTADASRLPLLDALRGVAALAVCWFHFTNAIDGFLPDGLLKRSGEFGWLGVEVFFVISGFIIPQALVRSGYRLGDYGRFLAKRLLRLHPPYLLAVLLALSLAALSAARPGFQGAAPDFRPAGLLAHFFYLNDVLHLAWLNPVFWTLAIELQYYLAVGLLLPVLTARSPGVRLLAVLGPGALAYAIPGREWIFHYWFLFGLGFAAFLHRQGKSSLPGSLATLALAASGVAWQLGGPAAAVATTAAALIAWTDPPVPRGLAWLGGISYSLYLIHVPLGSRVINLGMHSAQGFSARVILLFLALTLCLGAAALWHRLIEVPAQRWSSAIRYRR